MPLSALIARRLHDHNRSGWWQLIILTYIGFIPIFICLLRRGTIGVNKYGEDTEQGL